MRSVAFILGSAQSRASIILPLGSVLRGLCPDGVAFNMVENHLVLVVSAGDWKHGGTFLFGQ